MKLQYLGNKELLERTKTAFFASMTIQSQHVLDCYDWATGLNAENDCVISGFNSAIERDVLHFLLEHKVPVIIVLTRKPYIRIPKEHKTAYNEGRLLYISVSNGMRANRDLALRRNRYVAEMADELVFGMLTEQSSLYEIYTKAVTDNKKTILI